MSIFCVVDDKHIPLYRVMWIAATPHFCGAERLRSRGLLRSAPRTGRVGVGQYRGRDGILAALESWQGGTGPTDDEWH